jgi:RNA polymerase-binding transcription factor DksA
MASLQTFMQDYDQHLARLEELRGMLEEQLAASRADLSAAVAAGSATLAGLARRRRAAIESALARMDRGLYGTCVRCGAFIPYGVLRLCPYEQHCATCRARVRHDGEIPAQRPPAGSTGGPEAAPPGPGRGNEAGHEP